jgi:surfactin synthase thioesterase subunit
MHDSSVPPDRRSRVWGRHDIYFDLAEVLSWMRALPRMEAHVLDAGHLLLETHAAAAVSLMLDFVRRTTRAHTSLL